MATVEKKKRRVSYVESSFDQATSLPTLTIGTEENLLEQVRPLDGERTFPSQSLRRLEDLNTSQHGFLWADTPESSVFIRKKQWNDEGWNYIIEVDPNETNPAKQATEEEKSQKILAGEKLNRKIRDVLGKIITTKLEWLNDHEQFSKSSAALRTLLTTEEEPKAIQSFYVVGTFTGKSPETLEEIVNGIGTTVHGKDFKKKKPEEFDNIRRQIIRRNTDVLRQDAKIRLDNQFSESEFQKQLVTNTLAVSADIRLFYNDGFDGSLFVNANGEMSSSARELLINLYAPTQVSDGAFTRYFLSVETDADNRTEEKFNGVMEFANITSISTSVSLSGNGTANLTFEDPGNIMQISRDDIELVLAEVPYQVVDGTDIDINKVGDKDSRLFFYRGRYYTKTVFEKILSKDYTDIDSSEVIEQAQIESKPTTTTSSANESIIEYKVIEGDTLSKLAETFKTTIDAIVALNLFIQERQGKTPSGKVLKGKDYIRANEILKIPNPLASDKSTEAKSSAAPEDSDVQKSTEPDNEQADTAGVLTVEEKKVARDKLRKYVLNRYIIEPVDHVWIWMTSPSKSIFTLPSGEEVVEAPDSTKALELQIGEIDKELDEKYAELTVVNQTKEQSEDLTVKEEAEREAERLTIECNALETKKKNLQEQLESFREAKKVGKPSTDATSANRTDLLENLTKNTELYNVISETQGLSEQQFQVFEGVITDIAESYSNGKYTLTASCRDVFYFLEVSRIMDKPGLRGTTGPKYELNNPIITVKDGNDPKGFWKTGMLVKYDEVLFPDSEKNANVGKVQDSTSTEEKEVKKERISTITAEEKRGQTGIFITDQPFAKTDAANVVSLLITGVPYNVDLFIQNALIDGRIQLEEDKQVTQNKPSDKTQTTLKQDKEKNRDKSTRDGGLNVSKNGYFQIVKKMIGVQNDLLGDFKPFIPLSPDLLSSQTKTQIEKNAKDIKDLKDLARKILNAEPAKTDTKATVDLAIIGGTVEKLNGPGFSDELKRKGYIDYIVGTRTEFITKAEWTIFSKNFTKKLKTPEPPNNGTQANAVLAELYSKRKEAIALEKVPDIVDSFVKGLNVDDQVKLGTILQDRVKRREDIVRNRDENYLMISSEYTFNNDIESFNYMISSGNWSLWQSNYETPLNTCKRVAEVVNFEFFADENGNVRFEPPRYNRILWEHLPRLFGQEGPIGDKLRQQFKSNNFQKFIETIDEYKKQEAEVRKAESNLASAAAYKAQLQSVEEEMNKLVKQVFELNSKITNLTNVQEAYNKIGSSPQEAENFLNSFSNWAADLDLTNETRKAFFIANMSSFELLKSNRDAGQPIDESEFLTIARNIKQIIDESVQLYEVYKDTAEKEFGLYQEVKKELDKEVSDIKVEEQALFDKREELADLENQLDKMRFNLDEEGEYSNKKMRELTDDAKIHRIPDSIIVSSNFRESKPRFTRLDVSGEPNLVDLSSVHELYYWAGGVDYDLWRSYGFIQESVKLPYLHRGDACKPYCEALLGRQWGQIFTANITVRGDSKYRVHDVVYVESRDMYFRINTVAHNFTYGSSFQTTLTLDYGRRPEFIIPDPWDILGKTALAAVVGDPQLNENITKAERQQSKKQAEQETNQARDKAKEKMKAEETGTKSKTKKDEKDSSTVTQSKQVPQASTEAKENKKEQEKKDKVTKLSAELTRLKQQKADTEVKREDVDLLREEAQEKANTLSQEIRDDNAAGKPSTEITPKVRKRDRLTNEVVPRLEGQVIDLDNKIISLDKQIAQKTEEKNKAVSGEN